VLAFGFGRVGGTAVFVGMIAGEIAICSVLRPGGRHDRRAYFPMITPTAAG
jgi:hypothetical protein